MTKEPIPNWGSFQLRNWSNLPGSDLDSGPMFFLLRLLMEEITIVAGFWNALKPNQVSYGFIVLYPSSCGGDVAQILKNAKIPWCGFCFYTPRASNLLSCVVVFLGGKPNRFGVPQFGEIQIL